MNRRRIWLTTLLITGCAPSQVVPDGGGAATRVTGNFSYRERIALPPTAMIRVQLLDVSRADGAATVPGEQVIEATGRQLPFNFEVHYDATQIDEQMSYAVLTGGAPADVNLLLRSVGGSLR